MALIITLKAAADDREGLARALEDIVEILRNYPFEDNGIGCLGSVCDFDWGLEELPERPKTVSVLDKITGLSPLQPVTAIDD